MSSSPRGMDEVSIGLMPWPSGFGSIGGVRWALGKSGNVLVRLRIRRRDGCFMPPSRCKMPSVSRFGARLGIIVAATDKVGNVTPSLRYRKEGRQGGRTSLRDLRQARHHAPASRQGVHFQESQGTRHPRCEDARARPRAGVAAGVDRRLDLDRSARASPGDRPRRRRPQAVSLSRGLDRRTQLDQVPPHAGVRGGAAVDPQTHPPRFDGPGLLPAARAGDRRRAAGARPTFASATKSTRATNKSHGLTTLQDRHVKIRGRKLRFAFRGKSGVFQTIEIEEPQLAKAVQQCQDLPGQTLFQYRDDATQASDACRPRTSTVTWARVSGGHFTAKDFRTWAGTLSAAQALDGMPPPASKTAATRSIVEAVDSVAEALGNTRAVCRKCYIHPAVLRRSRAASR